MGCIAPAFCFPPGDRHVIAAAGDGEQQQQQQVQQQPDVGVVALVCLLLQGHNYTNMVWLVDYAYDVPAGFVEGKGMAGGYTLRTINSTRLCMSNINLTCLKFKGADVSKGLPVLTSHAYRAVSCCSFCRYAHMVVQGSVRALVNCSRLSQASSRCMQHGCLLAACA